MHATLQTVSRINVTEVIDTEPFGAFQREVLSICLLITMLDTIDAGLMSFAASPIAAAWHIPLSKFGPVFSIGLVGTFIGAIILGQAADTFGRRRALIVGVTLFGLGAVLQGTATSMGQLLAYRLLGGLGIGGVIPNAVAAVSEYSPQRIRSVVINAMSCGMPLGSALAGVLGVFILVPFGWRAMFFVGGGIPLALVPLLIWRMPESVGVLAVKKPCSPELLQALRRLAPTRNFKDTDQFVINERRLSGSPAKNLFTGGRLARTILIWILFFVGYVLTMVLLSWLPTLLRQSGIPLKRSMVVASLFSVGGAIGGLIFGWISKRYDSRIVMAVGFFFAFFSIAAVGRSSTHPFGVIATVVLSGFFLTGALMTLFTAATAAYPTMIRSTAMGWATAFGKITATTGPLIGGLMLATGMKISGLLFWTAAPALVGCAASLLLLREHQEGLDQAARH